MTRKEREYYNDLSIKAFEVKSRWRTMLDKPAIVNGQTYYVTLEMVEKAMIKIIEEIENESNKKRSGEAADASITNTSVGEDSNSDGVRSEEV